MLPSVLFAKYYYSFKILIEIAYNSEEELFEGGV